MTRPSLEPPIPPPANMDHDAAATQGSSGTKGKEGAEKSFSGLRDPYDRSFSLSSKQALGLGQRPHSPAGRLTAGLGTPGRPLHQPHTHTPASALLRDRLGSGEGGPAFAPEGGVRQQAGQKARKDSQALLLAAPQGGWIPKPLLSEAFILTASCPQHPPHRARAAGLTRKILHGWGGHGQVTALPIPTPSLVQES